MKTGTGTLILALVAAMGCRQDMHDQPRYEPFEKSTFFADGSASRPPVPDTVARGQLHADMAVDHGKGADGKETVFQAAVRLNSAVEVEYLNHGGILPRVLRMFLSA